MFQFYEGLDSSTPISREGELVTNLGETYGIATYCPANGERIIVITCPFAKPKPCLAMYIGENEYPIIFGNTVEDLYYPTYVAIIPSKNLILVIDQVICCVNKYCMAPARRGEYLGRFGFRGSGDGELKRPMGICEDIFGCLLVCDSGNHRISQFDINGKFIRHVFKIPPSIGDGDIEDPLAIACDKKKQKLAISFGCVGSCTVRVFRYKCEAELSSTETV